MEEKRAQLMASHPDNFYDKISDDRLDEIKEQVLAPRSLKSDFAIKQLNTIEKYDEYVPLQRRFDDLYCKNEEIRQHAHNKLIWS